MQIRFATFMDFRDLVAIGHKFFKFNPYRKHTTIDQDSLCKTFQLLIENHILLVVDHEDKVIGTCGAFIAPLYWNENYSQGVEAFWWIDPEHRQSGIGTDLRLAVQEIAKSRGITFWNMIALKDSMFDKVSSAYEADGFTPAETVYLKVL